MFWKRHAKYCILEVYVVYLRKRLLLNKGEDMENISMAENSMTDKDTKRIMQVVERLTSLFGISSDEGSVCDCLIHEFGILFDSTEIDSNGNFIGKISSEYKDAKTLLIEAHMDRVGLMVTHITDEGRIKFTALGGIDTRILPYSRVIFDNESHLTGVIMQEENSDSSEIDKMYIFTGNSKAELDGVLYVGDRAVLKSEFKPLCGGEISSGALDNRAGIAAVICALETLDRTKPAYNLTVLFSTEEELGLHGGYTGSKSLAADAAIIVDVTHGKTADTKDMTNVFPLGCGAVICRGPNLHYQMTKRLLTVADKNNITNTIEVASSHSGTTAWAIQTSGMGIPSMLISIPLKYMHTNVEVAELSDIKAVSDLISAVIREGTVID